MSIPYNITGLNIGNFRSPDRDAFLRDIENPSHPTEDQVVRAKGMLYDLAFGRPFRSVQLLQDFARLALKVPVRSLKPIFFENSWQEKERATVNLKLVGYAFVQLSAVPVKFAVALVALQIAKSDQKKAQQFLDACEQWTAHYDGRASQLEALKEQGAKKAKDREEFEAYRAWLYGIKPEYCL